MMVLTAARPKTMWGVNHQAGEDLFVPKVAIIDSIIDETPDTKTYKLRFEDQDYAKTFNWEPGQFVEVTVFGAGEAPIGFASSPLDKDFFEITVVARGAVTKAMHELKQGDSMGIRGPFGNCWPMEAMKGKDILVVSGGCGLAPLRPAILQILANRGDYGKLWLLYGARTPADRDFRYDLEKWESSDDIELIQTVDIGDDSWKGNVGVVTTLFDKVDVDADNAVALTCGPPIMIKFVTRDLMGMGFTDDRVVTSLERYMKCGVGKCGHCCINHFYICTEGPVITYREMAKLPELEL